MRGKKRLIRAALLLGAGVLVTSTAWAANTVRGVVTDTVGAGIPDAKVIVADEDAQGRRQVMGVATTDRHGRYMVRYKNQRWDNERGVASNPDIRVTVILGEGSQPVAQSRTYRDHDQSRDLSVSLMVTEIGIARLAATALLNIEAIPMAELEAAYKNLKDGPKSGRVWTANLNALKAKADAAAEKINASPYSGNAADLAWVYDQLKARGHALTRALAQTRAYSKDHLQAVARSINLVKAHREAFLYFGKNQCKATGDGWERCGCLTHGGKTPAQNASQCHPYCSKYGFAGEADCSAAYVP